VISLQDQECGDLILITAKSSIYSTKPLLARKNGRIEEGDLIRSLKLIRPKRRWVLKSLSTMDTSALAKDIIDLIMQMKNSDIEIENIVEDDWFEKFKKIEK